jgi:hypothetical protein
MAEDVNPMHLNLENMDSLDRVLCLYDNEANAGYKPQTEKKLTRLSTSGKPEFMLYFSRRYKNMMYAEIYPTWNLRERKFDYSKFYPVNYQGEVMAYAFTLKDDKIIAVRKGMYFCD